MSHVRSIVLLHLILAAGTGAQALAQGPAASPDQLWRAVEPRAAVTIAAADAAAGNAWDGPPNFRLYTLDPNRLRALLDETRAVATPAGVGESRQPPQITIPLPGGGYARFWIEESQILAPELAARFPEIRTFHGQGIDDSRATVQIDFSPDGFHAQILSEEGTVIVDPFRPAQHVYASYTKKSIADRSPFECGVQGERPARPGEGAARIQERTLPAGMLRIYRLAVATTGEYTAAHGGTVAGGLRGIATTMARVSGIYERELAIQFQLVAGTDRLIFTNAATDPFTNGSAGVLIDQSQAEIDRVIGNASYDLGHTFSTGAGGLAGLGVACRPREKARGVTGTDQPFGDAFDVDFVAHEIGHQLGADHTFNGALGQCGVHRNPPTAVEPGSGSTIQAYAGICADDDLQPHSHAYFHSVSLEQMLQYTREGIGNCARQVSTGNRPPTVSAGADRTVPRGTPFTLTANGDDPDGDPLTFCWEERDLGPQASVASADDGRIPLFRSFEPSTSPMRTFPRMVDILNGTFSPGELLPATSRSLTFRVTARDNRTRGGEVASDEIRVQIHAGAGPFRVTAPAGENVREGQLRVTWDVAATDRAPVASAFVNILFSNDDGQTFTPLVTNAPNDGEETVPLPTSAASAVARIKVESADNVFFAVSRRFQVQPPAAPEDVGSRR